MISTLRSAILAPGLAVLLAGMHAAHAQPAPKTCEQLRAELAFVRAFTAVHRLADNGCVGDARDDNAATRAARRMIERAARVDGRETAKIRDVALSEDERRSLTLGVLRIADGYVQDLERDASPQDRTQAAALQSAIQRALRDRTDGVASPVQQTSFWSRDGLQPALGSTGIDIEAMLSRAGCDSTPRGNACAGTQATVEGLLRAARLAERAFSADQAKAIQAAAARAAARDSRWRSYFADARSQYPWEFLLNSWRYEATLPGEPGLYDPPSWQWILLHPDVGMQYVRSAAAGERFKPALVLELIGYNRWSWGPGNKPHNAWGASLVRTYADMATERSEGWGIAVHRNNKYTATITRIGDKTGILLSIDLAGAVTAASDEVRDSFRLGR